MSGSPVVVFDSLTKRYGDGVAVRDVTFEVAPVRVAGLLGRNGAGESTSLRALLGLVRPTAGTATLHGKPYAELPDAANRVGVHGRHRAAPGRDRPPGSADLTQGAARPTAARGEGAGAGRARRGGGPQSQGLLDRDAATAGAGHRAAG